MAMIASTVAVKTGPWSSIVIDPGDVRTWPEEARRNHRLRRALHELIPDPSYRLEVGTKPDGTAGVRIVPADSATPEAMAFLVQYRDQLITHHYWLQEVEAARGTEGVKA